MIGLTHQQMADRLAAEFEDGWLVNLGVGLPTLCSNTDLGDTQVTFHAENGVIGYGPILERGREDMLLVNGAGQHVSLHPHAVIVDHLESFAIIRSGRVDVTVLGAYEVSSQGDIANWKIGAGKGGSIGGAMELAACSRRVFVMMEHATRSGASRLVARCALPVTARGVVRLVATNLGLFSPEGDHFVLREIAPGLAVDDVIAATSAPVRVSDDLKVIATRSPAGATA